MMKLILLMLLSFSLSSSFLPILVTLSGTLMFLACSLKHDSPIFFLSSNFYWDSMSLSLITLSAFITIVSVISSLPNPLIQSLRLPFNLSLMSLFILMILFFSTSKIILFYILFETSLVPTFILILGWGYQPERTQAGIYLLMYTILASLPLLIILLMFTDLNFSESFIIKSNSLTLPFLPKIWALLCMLAFLVKLPIYSLHLWLPKAHVEAPVAGSMILAALLLKLGGFGLLRFSFSFPFIFPLINLEVALWSLTGGGVLALSCLLQSDVKLLVALSSVAHMSLVVGSILTLSSWGASSALILMISHGFCSSGLFSLANFSYERAGSRNLYLLKGLQMTLPSLAFWSFMFSAYNMASPPSLNLLGEMNSMVSLLPWSLAFAPQLTLLMFSAAAYSLYLYSQSQHGKPPIFLGALHQGALADLLNLYLHFLPLNLVIMASWMVAAN